jgi:hypothetical protein
MRAEFLQAGGNNLGQVALLVALGNADRFIDLAFTQCRCWSAGQLRSSSEEETTTHGSRNFSN